MGTPLRRRSLGALLFTFQESVLPEHSCLLRIETRPKIPTPTPATHLVRMRIESRGRDKPAKVLGRDTKHAAARVRCRPRLRGQAYLDMSLPIGDAQTISSPFIVALDDTNAGTSTEQIVVLEIGTGSGYQAAVLSPLVQHVYTIEIVPELGRQAERGLETICEYGNVSTRIGDGFLGWPDAAPPSTRSL